MTTANTEVKIDRRNVSEDRRKQNTPVANDRRKVQRRRQIDPTTCERDYTNEEIEFMHALDAYKRANGRMFPTCSEILEVIRDMGYVQIPVEDATIDKPAEEQPPVISETDDSIQSPATDDVAILE